MKLIPRSSWTSQVTRPGLGSDSYSELPYYRTPPTGIKYVCSIFNKTYINEDPAQSLYDSMKAAHSIGQSDIPFNLGVAGNVDGVWSLRGLHNKSAYSSDPSVNNTFLSIYIMCGSEETPTDVLLRNVLDARRLVLSRYPEATGICEFQGNPYLEEIFGNRDFWTDSEQPAWNPPVGSELTDILLSVGAANVQVQDLQEVLAYYGYYQIRIDGTYNQQTHDAVLHLQADLKRIGLYRYQLDGLYDEKLRRVWVNTLKA